MNPPFVIYYETEVNNRNREETIKLINSKVVELNFQDKEVKSFLKSIDPFSNKVSLAN